MKQVTSMSRLTNQLEKMFRALNADFFDNVLEVPVITVTPSSRSYAHYTPWDAWEAGDTRRREINIASGTLNRPLEAITASLLHEMCHQYNDTIKCAKDTSRNNTYHNRLFWQTAHTHGLLCTKTERYGYAHTEPSDELLDWLLLHDELREIELCRINPAGLPTGTSTADATPTVTHTTRAVSRRYVCPCCRTQVRSTAAVNVLCGDCMLPMQEV